MSSNSTLEIPLHASTRPAIPLTYGISSDVPTTSALAESTGLLNEEFGFDADFDLSVKRIGLGNRFSGEGLWIREADHASALWGALARR